MNPIRLLRNTLHFLALALVASACTSIEERLEKAETSEAMGRYEEAAYQYVEVLEKEPGHPVADERLREVTPLALQNLVDDAKAHQAQGEYESGLGALARADRLQAAARRVGFRTPLPQGVPPLRTRLTEQTVEEHRNRAEHHALAGRWGAAVQSYDRASSYLPADSPQREKFTHRTAELHLDWAAHDMDEGAFRSAYARAGRALDVAPGYDDITDRAVAFQDDALVYGTRPVAFLPLARAHPASDEHAARVTEDLATVLTHNHWAHPVPFVVALDPVLVAREARRAGIDRVRLEPWDGAEVGRVVGADYVVMTEFLDLQRLDRDVREVRRPVRFKRGRVGPVVMDTVYVEQTMDVLFDAAVAYRVVDAHTRRVIAERTVEISAEGRVEQALFTGDYRDLDISAGTRRLFEESAYVEEQRILDGLVDELSEELAGLVFGDVVGVIP